jgi:tRNA threonylcarbamoyladenosine biosynthesis protein TsaB
MPAATYDGRMLTLAIDASTYVGDVALLDERTLLAEESTAMRNAAHERLMPAVAAVFERPGRSVADIDPNVCGAGPGSFTSLRIAGGIAKGIAVGVAKPLYAVPSLALLVGGADAGAGRYLAAIDALRGQFYVGLYEVTIGGDVLELAPARLADSDAIEGIALENDARIVSPSRLPDAPTAIVADPRARAVAKLSSLLEANGSVDTSNWEPAYGRLAEAQVKWESTHGRPLITG